MSPSEFKFVCLGFGAVLLILVVYVLSIAMREARLRKELDRVRRMVEKT